MRIGRWRARWAFLGAFAGLLGPVTARASVDELARNLNEFGFRWLEQESRRDSRANVSVSPVAAYLAVSQLVPGTRDAARQELDRALGVPASVDEFVLALSLLRRQLDNAAERSDSSLGISHRIYAEEYGFRLKDAYRKTLVAGWDASVRELAFGQNPKAARDRINADVARDTGQKIKDLVPAEALSSGAGIVLVSALHFHSPWDEPFPAEQTRDRPFRRAQEKPVAVPFMERKGASLDMSETRSGRWLRVPFRRGDFHLTIGLPRRPEISTQALVREMAGGRHRELVWRSRLVNLRLPRWTTSPGTLEQNASLKKLGLARIFAPGRSDFGLLSEGEALRVSHVFLGIQAEISEGSAKAPAIPSTRLPEGTSVPSDKTKPINFHVDRPYLALIEHSSSGAVLVANVVQDPR